MLLMSMLGSGGGTALGIAVSHTAMDGEAVVKVRLPHNRSCIRVVLLCVLHAPAGMAACGGLGEGGSQAKRSARGDR
jgi:hypothetical protein